MDHYAGLYFGSHLTTELTFKKTLLLYDELHVFDRASLNFRGRFGTIGDPSPFRRLPPEWQREDVRVICHKPLGGNVEGPIRESIKADLADSEFVQIFLDEFFGPSGFAWLFIVADGQYCMRDESNRQFVISGRELHQLMARVDWSRVDFDLERLEASDPDFMGSTSPKALASHLSLHMCYASHLLNLSLVNT